MTIAELREAVLLRDRECIAALLDRTHRCESRWGSAHRPDDLDVMTLGHVREHPGGMRRDEPGWCVALCFQANADHWESANAAIVRAYLEGVRRAAERCPPPDLLAASERTGIPVGRLAIMEMEDVA